MSRTLWIAALAASALLVGRVASAAPVVYFGENFSPANAVTGAPLAAHDAFLATLSGVSTQNFESFSAGDMPSSLTFTGSAGPLVASLAPGSGEVLEGENSGRFPTDGAKSLESTMFAASFGAPVMAFGFYATDVGDFGGKLSITLLASDGANSTLFVDNAVDALDGSLLFWGFVDASRSYTGIQIAISGGADVFAFDQMIVSGFIPDTAPGIPEPRTWAMLVMGFGALGSVIRRRRVVSATV